MEDYKKKYEDLRKNIEHLHKSVNPEWKRIIECYIPQLKESEDEKIRKEIIDYFVKEVGLYPGEDRKEHKWLRWLEKQGKQNPAWSEEDEQYVEDTLALLGFGCSIHSVGEVQHWLKSLKERMKGEL